jgi:ribonuclease VapC
MTELVLDASAVLAFLRKEPGGETVRPHLRGAKLSTVNYAEVLAKAAELAIGADVTRCILNDLGVERVPFDDSHAAAAASLLPMARAFGLSLADRACLTLAMVASLPVMTADRDWIKAGLQLDIRLIR